LNEWLSNDLLPRFEQRVLPIDAAVADACGRMMARRQNLGRPIGTMDAFIAATVEVHELTLVTRDISDFKHVVHSVVNPWT
jgi:predicted nucleic acid-binding protein